MTVIGGVGGQVWNRPRYLNPTTPAPFSSFLPNQRPSTFQVDWMDNEASTSDARQSLPALKPMPSSHSPNEDIVNPVSPSYPDPPPTYDHATEAIPAAPSQGGESTEEDNIPNIHKPLRSKKPYRNETTTSIISTTTTTTTTSTTSRTTSVSRPAPASAGIVPSSSRAPSSSGATAHLRKRSKSNDSIRSTNSRSSDPYLDALLARSIAALELSNALLQSTLATKSTLSSVLASDKALEKRERAFEERLLRSANPEYYGDDTTAAGSSGGTAGVRLAIEEREGKKMEWMREMEGIVRDVEELFNSRPSSPITRQSAPPQRRQSVDTHHRPRGEGGLVLGDHSTRTRSPPPRALTQYVIISGAGATSSSSRGGGGFASEETADKNSIYLPSTTGLRRGAHREVLLTSPTKKTGRTREGSTASSSSTSRQAVGHSPVPSTSSSGVGKYLTASNSGIHPDTHPEALPLSPQELLELSASPAPGTSQPDSAAATSAVPDRHAYLRKFGAHSGAASTNNSDGFASVGTSANVSANSTFSRASTRPVLSPHQPASSSGRYERDFNRGRGLSHAQTPSTTAFIMFSSPSLSQQQQNLTGAGGDSLDLSPSSPPHRPERHRTRHSPSPTPVMDHSRTASTATSHSAASAATSLHSHSAGAASISSIHSRSSRSSARSSLSLAGLPFSLSLPLPSSFSALRRSPSLRGLGSPTSTDGSEAGDVAAYSPMLEAIEDFVEEGEEADAFGGVRDVRTDARGRIQSPTRGRAIQRGRFRTADTLRRILDTSPSPLPLSKTPSINRGHVTVPINKGKEVVEIPRNIGDNSRSNTDSSNKTIRTNNSRHIGNMRDSFASAESLALAIPHDYTIADTKAGMHSASDLRISSSIISARSFASAAHSPSTMSSTSDIHSSDVDRQQRWPTDAETKAIKRRLSLRPAPRFMPRTPSGRTAHLEISGATARAPKMHAHLVELDVESPPVTTPATPPVPEIPELVASNMEPKQTLSNMTITPDTPSPEQIQQERRRTQSLSASVSSMLGQARALENVKMASAGKVKGGSNLKGSPAWKAQRQLIDGSVNSSPVTPQSTLTPNEAAPGSKPSSKRTSWIGGGLMGLGLAITPSSSANATPGASTPPMRVSFAKEPVRYSEERETGTFDEEDEEGGDGDGDEGTDVKGLDADGDIDGGLTIKPRNTIRRRQSWNGSVKGTGSRRVPSSSKRRSKAVESGKEKKEGWLEWFLTATTAGPGSGPGHLGASGTSMGIGREEMFESRRDDW